MSSRPSRMDRQEFERRKEEGQAFKRVWATEEWERTVAAWIRREMESPLLIDAGACPPESLVQRYWQLSGRKELAMELLAQVSRWLRDADLDPSVLDDGEAAGEAP